ncbi:MAG: AAA family ATPase [Muribaculaceae bacterium]|nr:AAA family ATPase [Muribaculaceae bacterium]
MRIQRPSYLDQLISGKWNGLIKIITGIRRCGKSYLLFNLFEDYLLNEGVEKEQIIKIPFDDWDYRHLCDPDVLMNYLKEQVKPEN